MKKSLIALLLAGILVSSCLNADAKTSRTKIMKEKVFYNQTYNKVKIAGELYKPENFDKNKKYPAIIVVHPAGGVKEQVAGLYAQKLAENGFVTLAYDAAYQGESGGEPHFLENPASRVEDVRSSVDYLTVSAFDLGRARRQGLGDSMSIAQQQQKLKDAAQQRTKEANGEPVKYAGYVPNSLEEIPGNAPIMYRQGYEYYRTPLASHPRSENKYIFSNYVQQAAFTAFDRPEFISPRPVLFIVGENAESAYFSKEAYDRALEPKEYVVIPNATHMEMYYKPEYVTPAVEKLTEFYKKNLQ